MRAITGHLAMKTIALYQLPIAITKLALDL
jgi:hypothetical protein